MANCRAVLLCFAFIFGMASAAKPGALSSLFAKRKGTNKVCLNIGSWFQGVGPFLPELGLVRYANGEPNAFTLNNRHVTGTPFGRAFLTQRTKKNVKLYIKVDKTAKYNIALGFAEVQKRFCRQGARLLDISVQSQSKRRIDIFKRVGCNKATFIQFKNIMPSPNGLIAITIRGRKGNAILSSLCAQRLRGMGTFPGPSTGTPGPRSPAPVPSRAATMAPSPSSSAAPTPSRSATPTPSNTPAPTPSRTASPTPSLTPSPSAKGLQASSCQQSGCINFEGAGDYVVIGNSMSRDEDREDCGILPSSSASLNIPVGARVKSAILYWSASGEIRKTAEAVLNGVRIQASKTYHGGYQSYKFYGAVADVTGLVSGNGGFTVSNVWYDASGILCSGNAAYAAWSMVVVFERSDLAMQRINVCFDDFRFTFPAGTYTNSVECIDGNAGTRNAKTTVVTFESDSYKGEWFSISGTVLGNNIFRGQTAPNLDIVRFDSVVLEKIRSGVRRLEYTVKSFLTHTRFGPAIEGLFMPIKVVAYTI